jgi:hypothetical protein
MWLPASKLLTLTNYPNGKRRKNLSLYMRGSLFIPLITQNNGPSKAGHFSGSLAYLPPTLRPVAGFGG